MRVTQNAPITPGRYWGPGSASNSGGGLTSPGGTSKASLILARINARARALKAGKSPLVKRLLSETKKGTSNDQPQGEDLVGAQSKFVEEPASTKNIVDEEGHADFSVKPNITGTSEAVFTCEEVFSDGHRRKKKKKHKGKENCEAEKETNGDDPVGDDVAVGTFKLVEEPVSTISNMLDITGKTEEVSSDLERKQKKKKKHKRRENSGELNLTYEEETVEWVKEDSFIYDIEGNKHQKKKRHRKERDENCEKIENANFNDTLGNTEEMVREDLMKEKKKKKKKAVEDEVGEDSQVDRLDDASCEATDESLFRSLKKKKKREKKVCDNINKENNLDTIISVVEEAKKIHEEKGAEKSKHKKRKRRMEESTNHFTLAEDSKVIEPEDGNVPMNFSTPETVKKKKKKKIKEVPEDFENEVETSVCGVNPGEKPLRVVEQTLDTHLDIHEMPQTENSVDSKIINCDLDKSNLNEKSSSREEKDININKKSKKENSEKKRERKRLKRIDKRKKKSESMKDREVGGFTLMREVDSTRKEMLHRTLPHWLANPTIIGRDLQSDSTSIDSIPGLDKSLREILEEQKIERFFPVQKAVIPEILASASSLSIRYRPHDICVSAPTGSGKTLAYVLPIVQALGGRTVPRIRALVLLPVQELAIQVYKVFLTYVKASNLKVGIAVGQKAFQKEQQSLVRQDYGGYHSCVDILVATPGKLADHLRLTKGIDLSSLRYLVFDEADHMLAADGGDWINRVEQYVKEHEAASGNVLIGGFQGSGTIQFPQVPLHRLLFSATLSHDPERLQHVPLYRPKLFTASGTSRANKRMKVKEASTVSTKVEQFTRPAEMREEYVVVEESVKPLILHCILTTKAWRKVLIFTNSVQATHKLAVLMAAMSEGLKIAEFSSIQKNKRHQIVSQFAAGKIDVLVSSDAMARGLDIPDIEYVVSYDVTSVSTYVHRIGRTARAGKPGTALSLVTKDTMSDFRAALSNNLNGATRLTISMEELEPYESLYVNALAKMKEILQQEELEKRQQLVTSVFRPQGNKKRLGFSGRWPANTGVKKFVKRLQNYRKPYRVR